MKHLSWSAIFILSCTGSIHTPPLERPCGQVFTPDIELYQETVIAAQRWSKATGCEYSVGLSGTPVEYKEDVFIKDNSEEIFYRADSETKPVCGIYFRDEERVLVSKKAVDLCYYHGIGNVVVHEIGHVLSGRGGHAPDGILARTGPDVPLERINRLITETSLLQVCSYQDCKEFIPETDWNLVVEKYPYYTGLPD